MNTFKERMESLQGNQSLSSLAERLGISVSTVRNYMERGSVPRADVAIQIADAMGVNVRWLITGEGTPDRKALASVPIGSSLPISAEIAADFALIPRLDIKASAGNGNLAIDEEVIDFLAFQASWLRARNVNPEKARVMTAKGDSMEPTIRDGDVLLVDTSIDRVRDNALYIIVFEGLVFVKRIHVKMNGSILLLSDNERYPPEEITQDAAPRLHVAGRVVWFGRSI